MSQRWSWRCCGTRARLRSRVLLASERRGWRRLADSDRLAHASLDELGETGSVAARLRALHVLGSIALETGDLAKAAELFATCQEWATQVDDRTGAVQVLLSQADVARRRTWNVSAATSVCGRGSRSQALRPTRRCLNPDSRDLREPGFVESII